MVLLDAYEPIGDMRGVQRNDCRQNQPGPAGEASPQDKSAPQRQRQGQNPQRPLPARAEPCHGVPQRQCGGQVIGPLIIIGNHSRAEMLFASYDIIEAINMPGSIDIGIQLIRRHPAAAGDRAVVKEQSDAPGNQRDSHCHRRPESSLPAGQWRGGRPRALPGVLTSTTPANVGKTCPPHDINPERQRHAGGSHGTAEEGEGKSHSRRKAPGDTGEAKHSQHAQNENAQTDQSWMMRQE